MLRRATVIIELGNTLFIDGKATPGEPGRVECSPYQLWWRAEVIYESTEISTEAAYLECIQTLQRSTAKIQDDRINSAIKSQFERLIREQENRISKKSETSRKASHVIIAQAAGGVLDLYHGVPDAQDAVVIDTVEEKTMKGVP